LSVKQIILPLKGTSTKTTSEITTNRLPDVKITLREAVCSVIYQDVQTLGGGYPRAISLSLSAMAP